MAENKPKKSVGDLAMDFVADLARQFSSHAGTKESATAFLQGLADEKKPAPTPQPVANQD